MPLPMFSTKVASEPQSFGKIDAIVGVAAGKGGVGKSSVVVNLAHALRKKGYQVGIMDTDIYGPSIRKMLPEEQMPFQKGAHIYPALCQGIKMISMAYFRQENEATAVRAPIANGLITQFIQNVQWGDLDFLLVDFPPGTGDVQLTLSQKAQLTGAVMVTTPQEISLLDVRKAISLFNQVKVPIIGIVENMSYYQPTEDVEPVFIFGKGGGERLAKESGTPLLAKIPLDPHIGTCGDCGESLYAHDSKGERLVTRTFEHLANRLVEEIQLLKAERKEGVGSFELVWKEMSP